MNVHTTHTRTHTRLRIRETETDRPAYPPKMGFEWQPSLHWSIFGSNGYFSSNLERSKICGILRHTSETTKIIQILNQIYQKQNQGEYLLTKKETKLYQRVM